MDQLILTDNEATIARPILKRDQKSLDLLKQCGRQLLDLVTLGWGPCRVKPAHSLSNRWLNLSGVPLYLG